MDGLSVPREGFFFIVEIQATKRKSARIRRQS
jgi:hypothetical protein